MTPRRLVQGEEAAGHHAGLADFRTALRSYAELHLDPSADEVVLVEPDEARHAQLRELWTGWSIEVVNGTMLGGGKLYRATGHPGLLSPDPRRVRAYLPQIPAEELDQVSVSMVDIVTLAQGAWLLDLDLRNDDDYSIQPWGRIDCDQLVLRLPSVTTSNIRALHARLRSMRWKRAGRAWGEAGASSLWVHDPRPRRRLAAARSEAIVRVGAGLAWTHDRLPRGERGRALGQCLRTWTRPASRRDVLDPTFGLPLPSLDPLQVHSMASQWASAAAHSGNRTWEVSATEENPDLVASECHDRFGLWPISFNFPGTALGPCEKSDLISPMIPGFPYAFDDSVEYLRSYASAACAITHRKAGWDCFRHVEILAAGSVPLMLDIEELPRFSMVHYPKRAMSEALRQVRRGAGWPAPSVYRWFRDHLDTHLSSTAMARYLLRVSGLTDTERMLFVDCQHPGASDYQSTLALVGLKQVLGDRIESMFPAPWIYADSRESTSNLYGRGFLYTGQVPPSARTVAEARTRPGDSLTGFDPGGYDSVVIGSCSRNAELAQDLLGSIDPHRTVWIHTEDTPPLPPMVRWMRQSSAHVFVRAIHRN